MDMGTMTSSTEHLLEDTEVREITGTLNIPSPLLNIAIKNLILNSEDYPQNNYSPK